MGEPGRGVAAQQLRYLRVFFERLPFQEMQPCNELTTISFCLTEPLKRYIFYFPRGGTGNIELPSGAVGRWFDPRTGEWVDGQALKKGNNVVSAPSSGDWVLDVDAR